MTTRTDLRERIYSILAATVEEVGVGRGPSPSASGEALLAQLDSFGRVQFMLELEDQLSLSFEDSVLESMESFDGLVSVVGELRARAP